MVILFKICLMFGMFKGLIVTGFVWLFISGVSYLLGLYFCFLFSLRLLCLIIVCISVYDCLLASSVYFFCARFVVCWVFFFVLILICGFFIVDCDVMFGLLFLMRVFGVCVGLATCLILTILFAVWF